MSSMKILLLGLGLLCLLGLTMAFDWGTPTPLDIYTMRDDDQFYWDVLDTADHPDHMWAHLNLTSQKWTDESYVLEPIWWHHLTIYIPKNPRDDFRNAAMLYITGGNRGDIFPTHGGDSTERNCLEFTEEVGAVCAIVRDIPNQPTHFADSPTNSRVEDFILAKTMHDYIESNETNPNPESIVLFAMAKAARMAMDAVHQYTLTQDPTINLVQFMPTGGSKRGWTAWLAACTDPRVFATVPVVLDQLNFLPSLGHHYQAYGGWSWAFMPYWKEDAIKYLYHPRFAKVFNELAIDPLAYNERLTMPKLVMSASGDEFFLPDDTYYYWDVLKGPKWFCTFENDGHRLSTHRDTIWENYKSFFVGHQMGYSFPTVTWIRSFHNYSGNADIVVTASKPPTVVRGWMADTTELVCEDHNGIERCRRDFRRTQRQRGFLTDTGIQWNEHPVKHVGNNQYRLSFPYREDKGYRGFFVQLKFNGPEGRTFTVSTEIQITPDTFPYPACTSEEMCKGVLK